MFDLIFSSFWPEPYTYIQTCPPVQLSTCQPVNLSTCQPVRFVLSIQLPFYLSVFLPVCLCPVSLLICLHVNLLISEPVILDPYNSCINHPQVFTLVKILCFKKPKSLPHKHKSLCYTHFWKGREEWGSITFRCILMWQLWLYKYCQTYKWKTVIFRLIHYFFLIILALENLIADVFAKGYFHHLSSFPNVTLHVICINTHFEIRKWFEL